MSPRVQSKRARFARVRKHMRAQAAFHRELVKSWDKMVMNATYLKVGSRWTRFAQPVKIEFAQKRIPTFSVKFKAEHVNTELIKQLFGDTDGVEP